ncbi:MAG: hypothetical protein QOD55_2023 [Solirubrobacteraceae bacterium]|jgi:hypothetical protein|nr:hypothetical protein [Solirubrobacteraceae bacterium]MEA2290026.1 hypothetical protein [Solirubrobacteraceae bacterium]
MTDVFADLDPAPRSVTAGPWTRRALMLAMGVMVVLALLNAFGQKTAESEVRTADAVLRLSAPATVRGGLFFQSRLDIRAVREIEHPRIVLDEGWVEGMQVNAIEPAAVSEASRDGRVVLTYDALAAGDVLRVWFQFQVDPTNVGRRSYGVELDDADRPLARLSRSLTVLP